MPLWSQRRALCSPQSETQTTMSITSNPSFTRRRLTTLALSFSVVLGGLASLASGPAHAGEIVKADTEAYKQAVGQKRPIIMHVHADWCPVCAKQSPVIEELMKEPEFKNVVVFKIDFDADKPLVEMLQVKYQSTLIAAKGSVEVERMAGVSDKDRLREFIRKSL